MTMDMHKDYSRIEPLFLKKVLKVKIEAISKERHIIIDALCGDYTHHPREGKHFCLTIK